MIDKQLKQCQTCGRALQKRLKEPKCPACRQLDREYRAEKRQQAQAIQARADRKALIEAEYGTNRLKVYEYVGQDLLVGGRYAIPGHRPMRRRCKDCRQDDRLIRGNWSPAFEDDEGRLILLCWPCYEKRQ